MSSSDSPETPKRGQKVRVRFRRNRSKPGRVKNWTQLAGEAEGLELDTNASESVAAKGDLSRRRTVIVGDEGASAALLRGTVVELRGLFAYVDDGTRVWTCTVRRVLRTRLIDERHAVTVGDLVRFRLEESGDDAAREGVIVDVEPRRGKLRRRSGRKIQTIVANVDQTIIVSSADKPAPRPNLIDRYIVASLAGGITPVVCMNKADLDQSDAGRRILDRYRSLGIIAMATSAVTGEGIDDLREVLKDKSSVMAGQSGVGKSSLLNAVQPGLKLRVGDINEQINKGKHTTSTATLMKLTIGGYVVDTPGVRSYDVSLVDRFELEAYFVEFIDHLQHCKYPDCTHTHETGCAVKQAVEGGEIHLQRYESYVRLFEDATN